MPKAIFEDEKPQKEAKYKIKLGKCKYKYFN